MVYRVCLNIYKQLGTENRFERLEKEEEELCFIDAWTNKNAQQTHSIPKMLPHDMHLADLENVEQTKLIVSLLPIKIPGLKHTLIKHYKSSGWEPPGTRMNGKGL